MNKAYPFGVNILKRPVQEMCSFAVRIALIWISVVFIECIWE